MADDFYNLDVEQYGVRPGRRFIQAVGLPAGWEWGLGDTPTSAWRFDHMGDGRVKVGAVIAYGDERGWFGDMGSDVPISEGRFSVPMPTAAAAAAWVDLRLGHRR